MNLITFCKKIHGLLYNKIYGCENNNENSNDIELLDPVEDHSILTIIEGEIIYLGDIIIEKEIEPDIIVI